MTEKDQKSGLKLPSVARSASKGRPPKSNDNDQLLATELNNIKKMLQSIQNATDTNTAEIAEIKSMTTKTDANVQKTAEQTAKLNQFNETPRATNGHAMSYVTAFRNRAAASALSSSSKRKRHISPEKFRPKQNFAEPKVGTKTNVNGLSVVPKPNRSRDAQPKFETALYVSGLDPSTTNEQLNEYIVANTSVTDATKFKVHKMVKKDADLSQLKYVSFKVLMNDAELIILDDKNMWPEGVRVRKFEQVPKNDLGRHFPPLLVKETGAAGSTESSEAMQM